MAAEDVLVWRPGSLRDGVCSLRPPIDVADSFEIDKGISRISRWKATARAEMDPDFPKDIALADSLEGAGFVVVSGRVVAALIADGVGTVEYLPLQIINHKKRVASTDHYIVNSLRIIDCIDDVASNVKMNAILGTHISSCERLVLRAGSVPDDAKLFRPARWLKLLLIRRELADRLRAAGMTGLSFIEPARYRGLY